MAQTNTTGGIGSELLYGVPAIAEYLGIAYRQGQYWVATTDIPVFKIGGKVCARRSSIDEWLIRREKMGRGK